MGREMVEMAEKTVRTDTHTDRRDSNASMIAAQWKQ